ncbi:hypothetical protein GCM10027072_79350 [Streptomyces bullii]
MVWTDPGQFLVPEASMEILTVALSAVREEVDYVQRLVSGLPGGPAVVPVL